jgi:heme A synthase
VLCWLCVFWTSIVLFFGANVTTTESGDATPEWPTSFGGAWYLQLDTLPYRLANELTHRYVVMILGIFTVILVGWMLWKRAEPRVRRLSFWVFGLLIAQAVLGGLRVKEWQFPYSGETAAMAHAILAEIFFCTLVGLLVLITPARQRVQKLDMSADGIALLRRAGMVLVLVIVQILLGVMGRHDLMPAEVHAVFALAVVPVAVRLTLTLLGDLPPTLSYLRRPGMLLGALLAAQVTLGIWSYLVRGPIKLDPAPTFLEVLPINLHMMFGAWTLGTVLLILMRSVDVYGLPTDERVAPLLEARAAEQADDGGSASASEAPRA